MKNSSIRRLKTDQQEGVALVIVLAFVVILTGVIIAYFSRSISNRAISDASASQSKVALFTQGAADGIIADLQEEIVLSASASLAAVYTNTSQGGPVVSGSLFYPATLSGMLPQINGTNAFGIQSWAPNFLKRSAASQPFYDGGNTNQTIPTNAIAVSTTIPALNGRSISMARWNSHYLLPLASATDSTPISTGTGAFAPPDWVLVARDGSNPTGLNTSAQGAAWSSTNGGTVIGRYAYAIYNEGGLLDANVAGYPVGTGNPPATGTNQYGYKPSLAYADLTQLGLSQSQVDELVAWRNAATTQAQLTYTTGTYPSVAFTQASGSNFYNNFAIENPSSYLAVSSTTINTQNGHGSDPTATGGETDRMFESRQQLISFAKKGMGLSGSNLNVLNYLATFTRGLNQPSLFPDQGANRPVIGYTAANGGNNAQNYDSYNLVSNPINPNFLTCRVAVPFTRADGSIAVVGEPFVKTRFALQRIAWLTYLGPSASRNIGQLVNGVWQNLTTNPGPTDPNYDIWQLENLYGIPASYLAKGTQANIEKYFGLVWKVDPIPGGRSTTNVAFHDGQYKWYYSGHNAVYPIGGGASQNQSLPPPTSLSGTSGSISRLADLASPTYGANTHEPDFFELLKATVTAGSKAKPAMSITAINTLLNKDGGPIHPYEYQTTELDTVLDDAIIQLGVNIIDQFKVDGYSSRIVFNSAAPGNTAGASPHQFCGVQNLPYLYRFNSATLKIRTQNPQLPKVQQAGSGLTDTGLGIIMDIPTLWNPYDSNSPPGSPGPVIGSVSSAFVSGTNSNFRVIVDSADPDFLLPISLANTPNGTILNTYTTFWGTVLSDPGGSRGASLSSTDVQTHSEKYYTTGPAGSGPAVQPTLLAISGTGAPSTAAPLYPGNSMLTFVVPNTSVFHEPTMLARAGIPTGSKLTMIPPTAIGAQYSLFQNSKGKPAWVSTGGTSGFLNIDDTNPLNLPNAPVTGSNYYIGVCAGVYPMAYADSSTIYNINYAGLSVNVGPGPYLTYRLQYADPNVSGMTGDAYGTSSASTDSNVSNQGIPYSTYDEKYTQFFTDFMDSQFAATTHGNLVDQADASPGGDWQSYIDPRTSRFASITGKNLGSGLATPGEDGNPWEFIDPANDEFATDRADNNSGYAISDKRSPNGGSNLVVEFAYTQALGWYIGPGYFHPGLLEQNAEPSIPATQNLDNGIRYLGDKNGSPADGAMYYQDPDGVVRGAMANYQIGLSGQPAKDLIGLPLATAYPANYTRPGPTSSGTYQGESRPYFLHRPFRSVAELGYVFSGTPWKNIDFFTPQSGDAGLLDVFTAYEQPSIATSGTSISSIPLIAGVVNPNTQQAPVLQAILSKAYQDEAAVSSGTLNFSFPGLGDGSAQSGFAQSLINAMVTATNGILARTSPTNTNLNAGAFENVSDLVGRWDQKYYRETGTEGAYVGPSGDLTTIYLNAYQQYGKGMPASATAVETMENVQRFRESWLRPLADVANTRVWNVMIDMVAQTGRYPRGASNPANFLVDGEQRYWIHVAIDRLTGQVLDKQIEVVKE